MPERPTTHTTRATDGAARHVRTTATSSPAATGATTCDHRDATTATARRAPPAGRQMRDRSPANWCSERVLDAAVRVHRALGPGLLDSAYRICLAHELTTMGLAVRQEVPVPLRYRGVTLETAYRLDLLVGELVVVEIQTVEALKPVHSAQLLTHLKLAQYPLGMLLNFSAARLMEGYVRLVNGL